MMPSVRAIEQHCRMTDQERQCLRSPEAPIVLLDRFVDDSLPDNIAADTYTYGCMLPYTPLHDLLLHKLQRPVVATSGNLSDEPLCTDETEALERLGDMADAFFNHNRPIAHGIDDSIVRVIGGKRTVLRRARGFAPMPLSGPESGSTILALGGHMKNTIALHKGSSTLLSPHIGDLDTLLARESQKKQIKTLEHFHDGRPTIFVCDKHPDYASTKLAKDLDYHALSVQHHYAHVVSCMAEQGLSGPVLGVAWDGTGYGDDGTVWGGEFFEATLVDYTRLAHLRPFALPGGEHAVKEPYRCALALMHTAFDGILPEIPTWQLDPPASAERVEQLVQLLDSNSQVNPCTSAGRLFDGISAMLGPPYIHAYEGQAPMRLEKLAVAERRCMEYTIPIEEEGGALTLDWCPMIRSILVNLMERRTKNSIAQGVHRALAQSIVDVAMRTGLNNVVLSGGCFQNRLLTEYTISGLQKVGFMVYWHEQVPPNDGGLCLGQAAHAAAYLTKEGI